MWTDFVPQKNKKGKYLPEGEEKKKPNSFGVKDMRDVLNVYRAAHISAHRWWKWVITNTHIPRPPSFFSWTKDIQTSPDVSRKWKTSEEGRHIHVVDFIATCPLRSWNH